MISQVRWREGVKEEIPNLIVYHAKAQLSLIYISIRAISLLADNIKETYRTNCILQVNI